MTAADLDSALAAIAVAVALVLLAVALRDAVTAPVPFAVLVLGVVYAAPAGGRTIPVPLYGAALLLVAELAAWSIDERVAEHAEAGLAARRLAAVLGVALLAAIAGTAVLAAARAGVERDAALTAAGAAALVAILGLLVRQAGRAPS